MKQKKEITIIPPSQEDIKIVSLLIDGKKGSEIAEEIGENENTLAFKLTVMRSKYDCKNTNSLIAYFLRNKLIS